MITLEYHPPYQSFGRPLTPEILEAIGIITGMAEPDAPGHRPGRFEFWTTTSRRGVLYNQGALELSAGIAGTGRTLQVREVRRGADGQEQREHQIEADVVCGRDDLWSPRQWTYSSWMRDVEGRILPETVLAERARRAHRTVNREYAGGSERAKLPGSGRVAFTWGLWEAVRHFPPRRGFERRFDCLEHLRKLKRNHRLRFVDTTEPELAGRRVRLHRFVQYGEGILPTEYFVDDAGRLLLVVDANRAAVAAELRPAAMAGPEPPSAGRPAGSRRRAAGRVRSTAVTTGWRARGHGDAPPNMLFVCTDQQHWRALRAAGNRHLSTPAMDALCRGGVRLEQSYCTNPICSPSRSSLFTGRMPSETGVTRLHPPTAIRAGLPTIGEWLGAQAGYDCVYAGKWHVPACHSYDIPGFRVLGSGQDHRGDISDVTASHAAEAFLRNRRGAQPFLLVASLSQPHDVCDWLRLNQCHKRVPPFPLPRGAMPSLPPLPANFGSVPVEPEYVRRYRDEKCEPNVGGWDRTEWRWYLWNYYRMVEMADAELGRILAALHASGQAGNTLVVFTSDHGEGLGEHRLDRKNFHYEAAVKVPLIFSLPGRLPRNVVNRRALVSGIDLMPTLCAFAGADPPELTTAVNLRPVLEGSIRDPRPYVGVEMSVRAVGRVLRTRRFKYVSIENDPVVQLFDLAADPGETRNLAARVVYRDIVEEHRDHLAAWEARLDPAPVVADATAAGRARRGCDPEEFSAAAGRRSASARKVAVR